ncbi:replication protein [Providencia sp.]|uniref:replication protein n=1 Tax=Providencia sp. TaxID=589 RepID=UPI003F95286F
MNTAIDNVYQFSRGDPEERYIKPEQPRMAELEDGYTKLANELLESLSCCNLTARQFRVMLALIRKTYGFAKKNDRIADSQLADVSGLSRQNVNKAKKELISMNYIILEGNKIGVNKEVSAWKNQSRDSVSNLKTKNVSNLETNEVSSLETHKRNTLKKKEITNLLSENSNESSDKPSEKVLVVKPDAVVSSPKGNKWGNPIATVVVFILLPVLFQLSMIRKLLILNMKLANFMFDRYDTGIKLIGVTLLKMRKLDRKK